MSIALALLIMLLIYATYRVAADYVSRSMRSYASAERVWIDLRNLAEGLLNEEIPQSVARVVLGLASIAGCGCFVRGMIISHYLPVARAASGENPTMEKAFNDLDILNASQKKQFWDFLAAVIVYDSFRNPIQGWAFRRILKSHLKPAANLSVAAKFETAITAFSVLSRKNSHI